MMLQDPLTAGIHHVALVTPGADMLGHWYHDLLGFEKCWVLRRTGPRISSSSRRSAAGSRKKP
jgi:hypothetical protein